MPQFDVYKLPRDFLPFTHAVNMQSDLVLGLPTRVCIPMTPLARAHTPATRLNPVVEIAGEKLFVMMSTSKRFQQIYSSDRLLRLVPNGSRWATR